MSEQDIKELIIEKLDMLSSFQREIERCYEIANRLDAFNPELVGAFTGTPSERIERQLRACEAPGFTD